MVDGVFTIPMMKRAGYGATFAAAVEATASIGGQIMPPITLLTVPYRLLHPAILLFMCIGVYSVSNQPPPQGTT